MTIETTRKSGLPSVSRSLQVLALAVLVLIVGATAQQLMQIRASILEETEHQMARLDMVFAEQTGRSFETIAVILRGTVDAVLTERDGAAVGGTGGGTVVDPAAMRMQISRRIENVHQILQIAVADADGRMAVAQPHSDSNALPPAGMVLLRQFAGGDPARLLISTPFRLPNGAWTALVALPIRTPAGEFLGVAVAWVDLGYFEDFYRSVELNENGAIILHRRDGVVLARFPHADAVIGTSFADMPPFRDVLAHATAGTIMMISPVNGSVRVLAIRALNAFPLAVQVSVDETRVLAGWRRQVWIFAMVALGASTVIVTQILLLARRSHQVEVLAGEFRAASETAGHANAALREQMMERERAEAALRQAQRIEAIGQLTGGVAHDFNNLLTVIIGNIDLLEETVREPRAPDRLAAMRAAAERGARLTAQLLAFARRQPLSARSVDLNAVIMGMDGLLRSALGGNVRIRYQLAAKAWPALVDPTQIELVILNLAINARDAMSGGGELTIATGNVHVNGPTGADDLPAGDYVMVRVDDTGVGMTAEVLSKVFEPFFTTKAAGAGSGLGLSQVFGTARQSGGDVSIDSRPGHGTTVTLHLPRATANVASVVAGLASAQRGEPERKLLLLVDDDPAVRETTGELLRARGYSVIEADGATAALEQLRQQPGVAVLVTDIVMPEVNGLLLAEMARDLRPGLAIVFISGYADLAGITGGAAIGRLVSKPFRPDDLAGQIAAALFETRADVVT